MDVCLRDEQENNLKFQSSLESSSSENPPDAASPLQPAACVLNLGTEAVNQSMLISSQREAANVFEVYSAKQQMYSKVYSAKQQMKLIGCS